jgi:RNase adaptor protein for sRNA GlmZ degradation
MVVIDSVRTSGQLTAFRARFKALHIHMSAPVEVLTARYEERRRTAPESELESFDAVRAHPTEAAIEDMAPRADLVLDTSVITPREMVVRASEVVSTLFD